MHEAGACEARPLARQKNQREGGRRRFLGVFQCGEAVASPQISSASLRDDDAWHIRWAAGGPQPRRSGEASREIQGRTPAESWRKKWGESTRHALAEIRKRGRFAPA